MEHPLNRLVRAFLAYLGQRDIAPEYLCRLAGIDPALDGRITNQQLNALWVNAVSLSGDELVGLHCGESLQLAALGIVGQIIQTSATIGEALVQATERAGTMTDLFSMEMGKVGLQVVLRPNPSLCARYPVAFRQMADLCLVVAIHEMDGLVYKKVKPEKVKMPFKGRDREEEYYRVLRIGHIIHSTEYLLTFSDEYEHLPLISANYELQRLLLEKLSAEVTPAAGGFRQRIAQYLRKNAFLGIPLLEETAANFNVSTRSLQRKLHAEGASYQQLVAECRMSLAVHYLEAGDQSIKEISHILGYNEMSAFSRAFKNWTGRSPETIRRQLF